MKMGPILLTTLDINKYSRRAVCLSRCSKVGNHLDPHKSDARDIFDTVENAQELTLWVLGVGLEVATEHVETGVMHFPHALVNVLAVKEH